MDETEAGHEQAFGKVGAEETDKAKAEKVEKVDGYVLGSSPRWLMCFLLIRGWQKILRCPREDRGPLAWADRHLVCASGHSFPVVDGVPVLLLDDKPDTEPVFRETLELAARNDPPYKDPRSTPLAPDEIDHIAQHLVAGSCGQMYVPLINKLTRYPIPRLRLPPSRGGRFLDIGCAWGRWSLAAAGNGYRAVGIDPSLVNVFAARRIARQLGYTENIYIVADGRYLPFADDCFDAAFSYSMLQHMSEQNVRLVLHEVRRTLAPNGVSLMELPNKWDFATYTFR